MTRENGGSGGQGSEAEITRQLTQRIAELASGFFGEEDRIVRRDPTGQKPNLIISGGKMLEGTDWEGATLNISRHNFSGVYQDVDDQEIWTFYPNRVQKVIRRSVGYLAFPGYTSPDRVVPVTTVDLQVLLNDLEHSEPGPPWLPAPNI
ncbi:MAG: hypothetical protein NUV69_02185 [Candidatus Curtissbacteria bacterium]|nr:hypothetical protein [Candidatus Curtissbacteria bacterium]